MRLATHVCVLLCTVAAVAGTAAAAAAAGSALPRQPDVACASAAVVDAVAACDAAQPDAVCCSALDAVYGNSSSPAHRCLCLPEVLYRTTTEAAQYDIELLTRLHACGRTHAGFATQWASRPGTTCPALSLSGGVLERLLALGDSPMLSEDQPLWAWSNLAQAGRFVTMYARGRTQLSAHVLGKGLTQLAVAALLAIVLLFFLLHSAVLTRGSAVYRALPPERQLVACQHAVYVVAYALTLGPQTRLAAALLFRAWTGRVLLDSVWTRLVALSLARAALFTVEACVRCVAWSWLLVLHHALAICVTLITVATGCPLVGVIGIVLDLFAAHELPLYAALLAYRLRAPAAATRALLRGATAWYAATRLLQAAMLAYMVARFSAVPGVSRSRPYVATVALCAAFTVLQSYTFVIYSRMQRKLARKACAAAGGRRGATKGAAAAQQQLEQQQPLLEQQLPQGGDSSSM